MFPAREESPTEKRNSGRTGPTSAEGRAACSQNAIKHGACAQTLILPNESESDWLELLARWRETYRPHPGLEHDFVLRAAQAEWFRLRTQRYYDLFVETLGEGAPHEWNPDELKQHNLCLRYKTTAERSAHREYKVVEQHWKVHRPPADPLSDLDTAAPFLQTAEVSIVEGKTKIYVTPSHLSIWHYAGRLINGAKIRQQYTFPDGLPSEFFYMFPNPADRYPGAVFEREIGCNNWVMDEVQRSPFPYGVPFEYAPEPENHEILHSMSWRGNENETEEPSEE